MTAHLDHDAAEGRVGPAHDGDAEAGGGAGDLHVGHLALQDGQPRDACTQCNIVIRAANNPSAKFTHLRHY